MVPIRSATSSADSLWPRVDDEEEMLLFKDKYLTLIVKFA